jgi:hypothetical protein
VKLAPLERLDLLERLAPPVLLEKPVRPVPLEQTAPKAQSARQVPLALPEMLDQLDPLALKVI